MTSKLRIRIGEIEIDFEGTEEFIKQELPELLKTASDLHKTAAPAHAKAKDKTKQEAPETISAMTTLTIAKKLSVKSGTDLIIAAAAHLTFVKGNATFSRQQLLDEIKTATGFYKKSMSGNMTKNLGFALGNDLTETATDKFALSDAKRASLEKVLANA